MKEIAGLLVAATVLTVLGAVLYPVVKIGGRWYAWKRASAESSRIIANAHRRYAHAELHFAMGAMYRHGGHRQAMSVDALAIGAAVDTSDLFTYDGEVSSILGTIDRSLEAIKSAVLVFEDAVTGAATNFFQVELSHFNSAGTLKNSIVYAFQNGVNATAIVPIDISGPVAGALTNPTGKVIQGDGWTLFPGDTIQCERVSVGTGLASPGFAVTMKIGSVGA